MIVATVGLVTGLSLIAGAAQGPYLQYVTVIAGVALVIPSITWVVGIRIYPRMYPASKATVGAVLGMVGAALVALIPQYISTYSQCLRELKDDNEKLARASEELLLRRVAIHESYTKTVRFGSTTDRDGTAMHGGWTRVSFYIDPKINYHNKRFQDVDTPEIVLIITQIIRDWARGEVMDCDNQFGPHGDKLIVIDARCEKWRRIIVDEFAAATFNPPPGMRRSLSDAGGRTRRWLHEVGDRIDDDLMREFVFQYVPISFLCFRESVLLPGQKPSVPCSEVRYETPAHQHDQLVNYAVSSGLIRDECSSRSLGALLPAPIGRPYKE